MSCIFLFVLGCVLLPSNIIATQTKPNIVLILTDDQDLELDGWKPMTKAMKLLNEKGATALNWHIHTPVCCPSRAELLTGRYFHNIKVPQPGDKSCMHANSNPSGPFKDWLFAQHFQQAGYQIGLFGKYLNTDVPLNAPEGITEWLANGGGNYYNPQFNYNGKSVVFNDGQYSNYSTSVIGNLSSSWIETMSKQNEPFFAYIAPKAPHIQDGPGWPVAEPAPWYKSSFPSAQAPRNPDFNKSMPDHHWLISSQPPLTDIENEHIDELYRSRHASLLSVDDIVESVINTLDKHGQLDNTYVMFTSDHAYTYGNFRMPMGKWNVYEHVTHIPFVIRGPGITPNSTFDYLASNVDVMPTALGLAGINTPSTMDGKSLAHLLVSLETSDSLPQSTQNFIESQLSSNEDNNSWRTALLIEYLSLGSVERYQHLVDVNNNTFRALRVKDSQLGNLLYAEFTDISVDYNFTQPPQFFELYNLDQDPFQLHNIFNSTDAPTITKLQQQLRKEFTCQATTCS